MNEDQLLPLLGQGGIAGALMFIIYRVGIGMVAAVKDLRAEVAAHTKTDLEHHGEVKEAIVRVEAKIDERVASQRRLTPIRGIDVDIE